MLLDGKVVIITGIGPGMGRKLAEVAAAEGASVVLGSRSEDFLRTVAQGISSSGGKATFVRTDVSDPAQCRRLAETALNTYGQIDGLVNCAYTPHPMGPIEDADLSQWVTAMQVNCFGALQMAQAVLPAMKQQGGGAIVNVGTMVTKKPLLGQGAYSISKAALMGATRQMAKEFGPYRIRVNTAVIGWMWGEPVRAYIQNEARSKGIDEKVLIDAVAANIPLGLIPPDEECAKSVLMLLSDYARMVTGAALDINGGEVMAC